MSQTWTSDQILALAPDAGSAKSGTGLAAIRHWVRLGCDDRVVWGECQGSGKDPYRIQIDLSEPAFKCSCPSRKFPCKHSLGLFLLYAKGEVPFSNALPDWVAIWIQGRDERSEKKQSQQQSATVVDTNAQAKRIAEREKKVEAGIKELRMWLRDVVRQGLSTIPSKGYQFWDSFAARMVDAQAAGIAKQVRDLAGTVASGDGWQGRLLFHLAKLHLIAEGYLRMKKLPDDMQAELRTQIGWTISKEELATVPAIHDEWMVLGKRLYQEDRLRSSKVWMLGKTTKRYALILSFAHGNHPLDVILLPGSNIDAELAFYSSAFPLRALIKEHRTTIPLNDAHQAYSRTIAELLDDYSTALAYNPWLEIYPALLHNLHLVQANQQWHFRDADGLMLPFNSNGSNPWQILAISGGVPITMFGEWNGRYLTPLSLIVNQRFVNLFALQQTSL